MKWEQLQTPKTVNIFIEEKRQQKNALILKDVKYRIYAKQIFIPISKRKKQTREGGDDENPGKYNAMFERRAEKGQCFNQPYLGTREFSAYYRLVKEGEEKASSNKRG
jgi:CRISPR-associated protein Cas5d